MVHNIVLCTDAKLYLPNAFETGRTLYVILLSHFWYKMVEFIGRISQCCLHMQQREVSKSFDAPYPLSQPYIPILAKSYLPFSLGCHCCASDLRVT